MRKPIIAGNWKMNNNAAQGVELASSLVEGARTSPADVCVCVPFTSLGPVIKALEDTPIAVGAQNMHYEESGAFTGEIAPDMLTELGTEYVVLGHSERRAYYCETDDSVNRKIHAALAHGLFPIVCCGESLETREADQQKQWVKDQLTADLADVTGEQVVKLAIAYEPIWAIGTGKTASREQAEEMCAYIRSLLKEKYGSETAEQVRILYGGSVKPGNIDELMAMENIDGALVGGASLKKDDFTRIMNFE